MKIKRYQARDMHNALRQVRAELGADAVILSTQSLDDGVEICVAADDEQAAFEVLTPVRTGIEADVIPALQRPALTRDFSAGVAGAGQAMESTAMSAELRSLRELLERQLAALTWNDFTRRDPLRAHALDQLVALGLPRDDAWQLLQTVPAESIEAIGSKAPFDALANALQTEDLQQLLNGPVALIGPPGAGKSTLLARLAVRAVVEFGAASLAIITLDTQRLGSADQTRAIGRLLGIETAVVSNAAELQQQYVRWSARRLVLIDTAGVQPRDAQAVQRLQEQLQSLPDLRTLLLLPASAQPELLQCCLERFDQLTPVAAVLTRIDEALSLGGALAALLRHRIPLAALCDGPRVPEDLQPARSAELVARAVALSADNRITHGAAHAAA